MFSTFVGLGRFINCQRPDPTTFAESCEPAVFFGKSGKSPSKYSGSLTPQSPPEPAGPYFFEQIEIF